MRFFKSAFFRFIELFFKAHNLIICFFTILLINFCTIFISNNIFEFPQESMNKISGIVDFSLLFFPVYFLFQISNNRSQLLTLKKWQRCDLKLKRFHQIESFVCGLIFITVFLFLISSSFYILNYYLGTSNLGLVNYFFERLLFLNYLNLFTILSYSFNFTKIRLIFNIFASYLILNFANIIVSNFPLPLEIAAWLKIIFPYNFNFSILKGTTGIASIFCTILLNSCFIVSVKFLKNQRLNSTIFACVFFMIITFLISANSLQNYQGNIESTIDKNIEGVDTNKIGVTSIFISRKKLFSQYSSLIDDYENYFWLQNYLSILRRNKISDGLKITSDYVNKNDSISLKNERKYAKEGKKIFFFTSKSLKQSTSLLGLKPKEFRAYIKSFFKTNQLQSIGLSSIDGMWSNQKGMKSSLMKRVESLYEIDIIDYMNKNFEDFDLVVINDTPDKKDEYYEALYEYFFNGGKVIFVTDNFSKDRINKYNVRKLKSNATNLLQKLYLKMSERHYLIPRKKKIYGDLGEYLNYKEALFSECNSITCGKNINGIFTEKINANYFFLPAYLSYTTNTMFKYEKLIEFKQDYFDLYESNQRSVGFEEVRNPSNARMNTGSDFTIAIQVLNKINKGSFIVIADKDIFSANLVNDPLINLTGRQIMLSSIIKSFNNSFIDRFPPKEVLSPKMISHIEKNSDSFQAREALKKNISQLRVEYLINTKVSENIKKSSSIAKKIESLKIKLDTLTHNILRRFFWLRSLYFIISFSLILFILIITFLFGAMFKNKYIEKQLN